MHDGIYSELQNTHGLVYNTFLTIFQGSGIWLYHFYFSIRVRVMVFKRHFQQYLSYIVAVSFIGGGNRSTRRTPPTCLKSLTNFIS